jgi:hypothetical protein
MDRVGFEPTTSASLRQLYLLSKVAAIERENCSNPTRSTLYAVLAGFLLLRPMGIGLFQLKNSFVIDLKSG